MQCDVLLDNRKVGQAVVTREGLYYRFSCRCRFPGEAIYKLTVCSSGGSCDLGIPVPEEGEFRLNTRLPVKRIGQEPLKIRAEPKHSESGGMFVPLSPEEPFRYISRLQQAHLAVREGKIGVILPEGSVPD